MNLGKVRRFTTGRILKNEVDKLKVVNNKKITNRQDIYRAKNI